MTTSSRSGRPKVGLTGGTDGTGLRIAIVCARFNDLITDKLLDGARHALGTHGVNPESTSVAWVPGAFELPIAAQRFAASGEFDAVVCLGAVIRGATAHFDFVAGECAAGVQRVQLDTGVPVVFGVLTTDTLKQALERAGDGADEAEANKGYEAGLTAIEMVDLLRQLPKPSG